MNWGLFGGFFVWVGGAFVCQVLSETGCRICTHLQGGSVRWFVTRREINEVAGIIVTGGLGILRRSVGGSTLSQVRLVFGCSFTSFLRRSVGSLPSWTLWM